MQKGFIDLGRKNESTGIPIEAKGEKNKVSYPSLYLPDGVDLGLSEDQVGKELEVTARICLRRVSKTVENGEKPKHSIDLEIRAIRIDGDKKTTRPGVGRGIQQDVEDGLEQEQTQNG